MNAPESESALISVLLSYPEKFIDVVDITPEYFTTPLNSLTFQMMKESFNRGDSYDSVSICRAVNDADSRFSIVEVTDYLSNPGNSWNVEKYIEIVRDRYKRRMLIELSSDTINRSNDVEEEVESIVHDSLSATNNVISGQEDNTFASTIDEIEDKIKQFRDSDSPLLGMSTGMNELDRMLDGIQPGQFIGFAAYTSQGKTWDALNLAYNLIEQGKNVCFISLENSKPQILTRLASIHVGVSDARIKKGLANPEEMHMAREYMKRVAASGCTIYRDNEWTKIQSAITKQALVDKPDIFILDYIQNIASDKEPVRLYEEVSSYLQNKLIDIGIPMLALSQISNETAAGNTRDEVLKFKGSGAIGASVSTAIYKKSCHKKEEIEVLRQKGIPLESWWIVDKNRDGDYTGRVKTYFHPWSHKLWGKDEFDADYGLDRYYNEVREALFDLNEDSVESRMEGLEV